MASFYNFILIDMAFLFVFFVSFVSSIYTLSGFYIELMLSYFGSFDFMFSVEFNSLFFIYFLVVMMVFSIVFLFSMVYFSYKMNFSFLFSFVLFLLFMELLVISSNFFSMMFAWDGLGITSYYLVSFYSDKTSLESGLVTFVINRLGDSFIVLSMSFFYFFSSSSIFLMSYMMEIWLIIFVVGLITKSAQYPFNSWLPMAMSAPTPVSALVHSSTLVTAGIVVLIKFSIFFDLIYLMFLVKVLSILTIFMGSMMGIYSTDLKKLVAYSTLSQMGFIVFSYSMNNICMTMFHMIIHAFFKSVLFILVGTLMTEMFLIQDSRLSLSSVGYNSMNYFLVIMSTMNLMGLPLLGGWLSKDLVLEFVESFYIQFFVNILFWFLCCLTIPYSLKIMNSFNFTSGGMINKLLYLNFNFYSVSAFVGMFFLTVFSLLFSDLFMIDMIVGGFTNLTNFLILILSIMFYLLLKKMKFLLLYMYSSFGLNYVIMEILIKLFNTGLFLKNFISLISLNVCFSLMLNMNMMSLLKFNSFFMFMFLFIFLMF